MIKKNVQYLKEKRKQFILKKKYACKKNNNLLLKSEYIYHTNTNIHNLNKKIKLKNICLKRGAYNNNFGMFKLSRHHIKYLLTWKLIYIKKFAW